MRTRFTMSPVAAGLLVLPACSKADDGAAGNAADTGIEAGNLTGDDGALGNDVSAVDGDAAFSNGLDDSPVDGNSGELAGNAADTADTADTAADAPSNGL